jgi:hypothetical protein
MNTLTAQQIIAGRFNSGGIHVRNRILNYLKFEWSDIHIHPEIYERLIFDEYLIKIN